MRAFILTLLGILTSAKSITQDFWQRAGLQGQDVRILQAGPESTLYASIYVAGVPFSQPIYRTTDNGESWRELSSGLPDFPLTWKLFTDSSTYVFAIVNDRIYRIAGRDTTWTALPADSAGELLSGTATRSGTVYVGGSMIYKSTTSGDSWFLSHVPERIEADVRSIVLSTSGTVISSITTFHGATWITRSTDSGSIWMTANPYSWYMEYMAVSPTTGSIMGYSPHTGRNALHRSTDDGFTWGVRDTTLDGDRFAAIAFDKSGELYAGNTHGIFVSSTEGVDWTNINHNLASSIWVYAIAVGADSHLYIGTLDSGVYRSAEIVTAIAENPDPVPDRVSLLSNYPNPFNAATQIVYTLPREMEILISVYNVVGEMVFEGNRHIGSAGRNTLTLDLGDRPSGVYLFRLTGAGISETRKLLLMR